MDFRQVIDRHEQGLQWASRQIGRLSEDAKAAQAFEAQTGNRLAAVERNLNDLKGAMGRVQMGSNGNGDSGPKTPDIRYIESIPGRRIAFDMTVRINMPANSTNTDQGTRTVSQTGPFVAVGRYCAFLSALQFQVRDPDTNATATFLGRSSGRWRPTSSLHDVNDASAGVLNPVAGLAFPGTGAPIVASPSNLSGFRTMEWDGFIKFMNAGSDYERQVEPIPSCFYNADLSGLFQLGALDFFERNESLQWIVTPTHTNNPSAGNLSGYAAGGLYPFLASQYDVHEGISDPLDPDVSEDPVTRLPNGILVIGFHGFRIVQPPGPVKLT